MPSVFITWGDPKAPFKNEALPWSCSLATWVGHDGSDLGCTGLHGGVVGQFWLFGLLGKKSREYIPDDPCMVKINQMYRYTGIPFMDDMVVEDWSESLLFLYISLLWPGGGFNFVQDIQMRILQSTLTWGDDPIWQVCLGRGSLWMQSAKWVCLNLVCSGKFLPKRELCVSKNHPTRFNVILRRFAPICPFACFTPNSDTTSEDKRISNKLWQLWEGSWFATQDFDEMARDLLWEFCLFWVILGVRVLSIKSIDW